jgi:hypothetical protein
MKVLVLYEKIMPKEEYLDILKELKIDLDLYRVEKGWENNEKYIKLVSETEKYLLFVTQDVLDSSWIKYISGLTKRNSKKLFLYSEKTTLPEYLEHAVICSNKKSFKSVFSEEFEQHKKNLIIQCAKDELSRIGYSFGKYHYFYCIKENIYDAVELFLIAGINPDSKDEEGVTGLCNAVRRGCNIIARLLIDWGCNIKIKSDDNHNNALMDAAAYNNEEMLDILIEHKSDLDEQSKNEQTALMLAVGRGNENNTKRLLEAGADTEIRDVLDMTALRYAEILKNNNIIKLFEEFSLQKK